MGSAKAHGDAFGFHPDGLFVAHPIQDRTDDEMRALADAAYAKVRELICQPAAIHA